ncbi:molybdopterin molybdotransferase MoeA [Microbacteriaceae bacterium VKM Ac-2854]|nr:molybdopterin molybdotransferase MoeA [Microbacteriaceae bacterium VKM Ac-2854]
MSTEVDWDEARAIIAAAVTRPTVTDIALFDARGLRTAADVRAPRALPHYDSSAMDGWAVRGPGPWRVGDRAERIVTGALVPTEADAVLPVEQATVVDGWVHGADPRPGRHIRRAGDERSAGAVLVAAGERLTPARLALLAVAGFDAVRVHPRVDVALIFTGDEIDAAGMPGPGRVRDAFTPILPAVVEGAGGRVASLDRLGDDVDALATAIRTSTAPIVLTTGGTGRSHADVLRSAIDGELLFDSVRMRPGHPTLAARLADGRLLIGLPGNPLAAVLAALSFLPAALGASPLETAALAASPLDPAALAASPLETAALAEPQPPMPRTALIPVRRTPTGWLPAAGIRSHMLTGLAAADAVAVVPPEGGTSVRLLPLPW